jgi:hypothetical protein
MQYALHIHTRTNDAQVRRMRSAYITAAAYNGGNSLLTRISELFVREPDTDIGFGNHYIFDIVEGRTTCGGSRVVAIVCENHDIPLFDFRSKTPAPIRDIVKDILEKTPPRCAILIDTRDSTLMKKVRKRIVGMTCDLHYRRVVFCLVDTTTDQACLEVPGSLHDRMAVLLYYIPRRIQSQSNSLDNFRPLAQAMVDYSLFEHRIWQHVKIDGTLPEFLSTAHYQVVRRVRADPGLSHGEYPSFETNWRQALSTRLYNTLATPPAALCPSIHRVIPIGVSSSDALQAMTGAIPTDIQDPYAITVQSSAVDDNCGTIAITQPMQYTVVNVNCMLDPGILVDVCRELRTGHRTVVNEVHSMNQQMKQQIANLKEKQEETNRQISTFKEKQEETNLHLASLVARLAKNDADTITSPADAPDYGTADTVCTKTKCPNMVTTRFRSGKRKKQCSTCRKHMGKTTAKRKALT